MMNWIPNYDRKAINRHMQQEATRRKAEAETEFFWSIVRGIERLPSDSSCNNDSDELFAENETKVGNSAALDCSLPVERSGPNASAAPELESFEELKDLVPSQVLQNLARMRIESPTPIQKHAIPLGLHGFDLMCCSQTGSGKTVAFLIPMIAQLVKGENSNSKPRVRIDERGALPRGVIIAPTRELVSQIFLEARKLSHRSSLKTSIVYGGADIRPQLVDLTSGCDIVVATPGRLNDLIERGVISLTMLEILVLDEADRMLDMGFEPQIRQIVYNSGMPPKEKRQTFMFSATFPDDIQVLAREFLRDYVWIGVGRTGSTVDNIQQVLIQSSSDPTHKLTLLANALKSSNGRTLIFVQRKKTASWVSTCLNKQLGVPADEIHGDRTQIQREVALQRFRDGVAKVLVATDVASRGLDIPAVTHVIQFDMPISPEDFDTYIHRIGRTGRMGQPGIATSLFVPGREVGEGNGKIAPLLLKLLKEAQQEIPEWFESLPDHSLEDSSDNSKPNKYSPKSYSNPNNNNNNKSPKFGGRDIRDSGHAVAGNSYMMYHQVPTVPANTMMFDPYSNSYPQVQLNVQQPFLAMQSSSTPSSSASPTAAHGSRASQGSPYVANGPSRPTTVFFTTSSDDAEASDMSTMPTKFNNQRVHGRQEDGVNVSGGKVITDKRRLPVDMTMMQGHARQSHGNHQQQQTHQSQPLPQQQTMQRNIPPQHQHQQQPQFVYQQNLHTGDINMVPLVSAQHVIYPQVPYSNASYPVGNIGYISNMTPVAPALPPGSPMLVAGTQYIANTANLATTSPAGIAKGSYGVTAAPTAAGGYMPVYYNPYQNQYYTTMAAAPGTTTMLATTTTTSSTGTPGAPPQHHHHHHHHNHVGVGGQGGGQNGYHPRHVPATAASAVASAASGTSVVMNQMEKLNLREDN